MSIRTPHQLTGNESDGMRVRHLSDGGSFCDTEGTPGAEQVKYGFGILYLAEMGQFRPLQEL